MKPSCETELLEYIDQAQNLFCKMIFKYIEEIFKAF